MEKNSLPKAQSGKTVTSAPTQPSSPNPLLDEQFMQQRFGGYRDNVSIPNAPSVPYTNPYTSFTSSSPKTSPLANLIKNATTPGNTSGGGKIRTLDEYAANENGRYDYFMAGDFDNEDAAAQNQSFGSKMVNGVGKGLLLTGTTFLQSTVGLVNGTYQAIADGKFSSFYDNEFNRSLDEINKYAEDALPNYYTAAERDANWYSPTYWATGNFLWDGVVKNLGFAAGAALSGGVYTNALKALPYSSRLFSVGKSAETLAATEAGLAGANKVADTYGKVRALSDKFLSNYNTLNPAGRAVVAGLSTTGEAGIEALHSSNEFRKELIDEHIAEYGVEPTGAALESINTAVEASGNATFFANVGILTATNYVQFPKILGSTYKAEKGIVNGIVREIDDIVYEGGKYIKPKAKYPALSRLNKIRPYTFSVSEAFEEVSQYSATVATQDYYNKARNGEATSWLNSIGVGITDGAFSNEGAKNALIGGISGSIMLGRGRFRQDRARRKNTAQALKDLNNANLSDFTKETIDAVNRGTVLQEEREQAVKNGDILNSKDLEADYIANYLTPRIKYGRYDLVKADINEYKKLASTEEGFAQLQSEGKALESDTKEAYLERLGRFEQTADNVKSLWQSLNLRYSGQVDENGKPIYSNDVINKMLYAATKVADYDQRILDMMGPLTSAGINTSEVIEQLVAGNSEAFNEAVASIQEMDILDDQKETLGQSLEDVSELALRRQSFLKAYQDIKENPSNFSEAPIEEDAPVTGPVETVTVKTKQGDKEVELNTPYFVGKGVDYAKDPLDAPVPISQFVVQKVNEDGTLEIKTENGEVKNVSADVLENFKIGKTSTLQNNKTANYYYNHRNEIFEFNFGKNFGGRRKGRLEYQDGKLYFVYKTKGSDKTTKVETTQADVKQKVSKLEKRINRAKSMFANAKTGAEKAEALITFLNNAHHTDESVNEEDMAWFNNAKKEVEADGYIIDNEIGREISENENVEFGIQKESDSVPKGTIIVNYVIKPGRLVDGKQVEKAKYHVLVGTGTTEERDILLQELEDAENALDPKDLEGTRGRYDAAKKALKEYDDANFTKPGAEANLKKELTTYKKAAPKAKTKVSNSNIKRKQLDNSFFVPQEGFDKPRISKVGSVENQQQKDSREGFMSPSEIKAQKATLAKNREARLEVLTQLGEESKESLEETNKKLAQQTKKLAKIKEDLENIAKMKEAGPTGPKIKLNFSKATKVFTKALNNLTSMQADIEAEIDNLNSQKEELELNISYFQDFANQITDAPEDSGEFLRELKSQVSLLVDNGKSLNNALSAAKKLAKSTEKAIKSAAKLFRKTLKQTYIVDQDYSQYLSDLLDQVVSGENLLETWPLLKQEMANFALTVDLSKEGTVDEAGLLESINDVKQIEKDLADLRTEYKARKIITDRFQSIMDEFIAQKTQEAELKLRLSKVIATADKSAPTDFSKTSSFESQSKKSPEIIYRATTFRDTRKTDGELKPDEIRANQFGLDLDTFENRDNIRGLFLTSNTQDLKLPGVIEQILDNDPTLIEKFKDSTIVMVMVNENSELVGVDGQPIPEGAPLLDNAIYQTMPEPGFRDGSMYREGTAENVKDAINKEYKERRDNILEQTALGVPQEIEASFGIPQTDDNARTSVEDAGLVDQDGLERDLVLYVPTTNTNISKGTTTYNTPLGSVFLDTPTGYVRLRNRLHTKKEATAIYDAILKVAKNLINPNEGVTSDSSIRALEFLKGVTYWGVPTDQQNNRKDAGNNSVFFEKVKLEQGPVSFTRTDLIIGSKGTTFGFTPISLEANRELIINELENIYNNVTAYKTKDVNKSFEQITSISPEGEIESITWPNYQSYLLSNKNPDGSTREGFELPLYTNLKEKKDGEFNRVGVYFYVTNTTDEFEIPEPATQATNIPLRKAISYTLDGKTTNTYTSPNGAKINFRAFESATLENYEEKIQILQGGDLTTVVETIKKSGKDPQQQIKQTIYNAIAPQLTEVRAQSAYKEQTDKSGLPTFTIGGEVAPADPAQPTQQTSVETTDDSGMPTFTIGEDAIGTPAQQTEAQQKIDSLEDQINQAISDANSEDLRVKINQEIDMFEPENWTDVESWLKKNFPNVPVFRVKNIIQATNGRQAWGMFKDGAIYVYENAETGTAYHEVFEAVWKMFTGAEEQANIINEFKARKGTFIDRPTGQKVKYSEATPAQIKEELAEQFRDFVQKKQGVKGFGARIAKLFRDLKRFIENALLGNKAESFTDELFKRIGSGYYKKRMPYATQLSMAQEGIIDIEDAFATSDSEFRLKTLSDRQTSDTVQEMTFLMLNDFIKTDKSLFTIVDNLNQKDFYEKLLPRVLGTVRSKEIAINNIIDKTENLSKEQKERLLAIVAQNRQLEKDIVVDWPRLTEKHKEYIKAYNVEFDENDEIQLSNEDRIKESNKFDATKIDSFRKANAAIKLLLAANPIVDKNGKAVVSTINGRLLNPVSKMYITLMNKLHTSTSPDDMLNRLADMAVSDATYRTLYKRLTGNDFSDGDVDFKNIKSTNKMDLITGMWKTFKKQASDVKNIFIFSNGEVAVGDATLSSGANQLRNEYVRSIAVLSKSGKSYFTYNEKKGSYTPNKKKLGKVTLRLPRDYTKFLSTLGIQFSGEEYNKLGKNTQNFKTIVEGIKESIEKTDEVKTFSAVSLDINKRLLQLAELKTAVSNPEFSSTYFNLQGERVQTFLGVNAASELHNTLDNINNINELAGTQYEYLLKDVFTQGSTIISRMFDSKTGKKRSGANNLLKGGYVGGIIDETKGRITPSARLTQKQRIVQELNLNKEGYYLNLVPGDAGMEHMLYMGNVISANDIARGLVDVNQVFKGYFLSELELSKKDRPVVKGRDSKDLRFFKGILGDSLHNKIITADKTSEEVYAMYKDEINQAISSYIQSDISRMQEYLTRYGILAENETGNKFILENVGSRKEFDPRELTREMAAMSINYMIANIEVHKVLYSDPYQYKDELKRTKSFLSPRQALFNNSPKANTTLNKVWNEGFEKGDIGYTNFTQDYMRTASHQDVVGVIDLPNYESFKETDGGGIISFKAYRNFRIRAGEWNDNEEKQYRYDIAYEKRDKKAYEKRDKKITLSKDEVALLKEGNPAVQSAYVSLKPIVSGAKLGYTYNNVVLDKYALYPLSYRVMKELDAGNGVKLYNKMQDENIDYIVFDSGRKVGAENSHATYVESTQQTGEGIAVFNDAEYKSVVDVPFSIMSLQSDVPSKEAALVTRGSQTTKLITMDYMDNGVPFDYKDSLDSWIKLSPEQKIAKSPIYKEIANNQRLLEEMTNEGYQMMLKRLGIKEQDGELVVEDFSEAAKTIRDEVFRRETNDNISDAVSAFSEGEAVLEATPAYQQVRNILYSIVDKQIVRPKISGGQKVQIPSALFESNRIAKTKINGKEGYTSDVLGFYSLTKDGKEVKFLEDNKNGTYKVLNTETGKEENIPVNDLKTTTMEIMVGRWFQSNMSDAELLEYLNNTEEGQKILSGLAFRIPTQKQNSIDAIRIKKFLPKEFGDNVVVPAAIVKKVGSDFDIDKLSVYLKNVFYEDGKLKLVSFYGFGQQAKDKFAAMFDSGKLFNKDQQKQLKDLQELKGYELTGMLDLAKDEKAGVLFETLGVSQDEDALTTLVEELKKDGVRDAVVNRMYKQSLENEFIQSSENLVTHPANFERLTTPNSAEQLKGISKTIVEKVIGKEFDYTNIDNMLDRRFMSRLRQAFVAGKQAIGIAAVQQTIHSLLQRSPVFIDSDKLKNVDYQDQKYLGDGKITFQKYNKVTIDGQEYPSLSGVYNAAGQLISDILGQFIDGYVDISKGPWIMEMGATPNVAATFMFLTHLGVPIDTIAYFMNQPIIRDYLQSVENAGYKFLFIDDFINQTIEEYGGLTEAQEKKLPTQIPSKASLLNSLGKTEFTDKENLEQVFMLQEFLKYAKMANQLYTVTQGTNWDTSRFNDSLLVFKKNEQFNKAKDSILSSKNVDGETVPAAEAILSNSFIRNQASKLNDSVEALSNFILSDRGNVGNVIRKVLKPYTSLPDRKFISVGRKAVNDLFDWAVQTDQGLNLQIQQTLLSDKGVASEVVSFIDEVKKDVEHALYYNHVIDLLQVQPSRLGGETTPSNVSLKNTDSKAYDQNNIIYAFRDLRDHLKDKTNLYDKIVTLAILQSGLSSSPISFTSLIPYEDFARIYNKTLPKIENLSNLDDFYELGIFQRNNWNNDDIVPNKELYLRFGEYGPFYPSLGFSGYNNLKNAMRANEIPQLVTGNDFNKEYQVFTWTNYEISREERNRMRKQGDYSYRNKGLFKIVKDVDGDPIFTEDKKGRRYPIYKAINAFGDSFRANEFYSEAKQSIIDNGMMKVDEVTDGQIVAVYENTTQTSKYNKAITGPLEITVTKDRIIVNGRMFAKSIITAESLKNSGFTDEQAGEIINKKCKG